MTPLETAYAATTPFADHAAAPFVMADTATIAAMELKHVRALRSWPPLAIQRELWAQGGITAQHIDAMTAYDGPNHSILGRVDDSPGGSAYGAIHGDRVMVHAVHVIPRHQRKGLGRWMMVGLARWAAQHGAQTMIAAPDTPAGQAFFARLGFVPTK